MRGATLTHLLALYRQEARLAQDPGLNRGDEPAQIQHIQRVQDDLWSEYDWPHLRVNRDFPAQLGQRYYDMPADVDIDRIIELKFRDGANWYPIRPGINYAEYSVTDSDLGVTAWPIRKWTISEDEMIEVWPVPNRNGSIVLNTTYDGVIRVVGIKKLSPLVAPSDTADIDDKLIAMFCGAERLAASGAKDAQFKLDKANARLARLRGNLATERTINMFSTLAPRGPNYNRRSVTYKPPV